MEFEVSYSLENEQQFWDELDEIVSTQCDSEDRIDNALRSYLNFTTKYKADYLHSDYDISRCSYKLLSSTLFLDHADYVRRQIIYSLLQEDESDSLHLIASFLLFDGRQNENTFIVMSEEGLFPRLLELIQAQKKDDPESAGTGLHQILMDLLYEMARIQRLRIEDLVLVDDEFIKYLFELIEELSCDSNDPYHYPVIRVLLVLNEQFMISAHDPVDERAAYAPPTNKVIKVLSMHGSYYKTFGENIILLINREAQTSLQLLTLKLLYLIFTTPSTYEYFYTNDLHVLVDILIRNLLDLPEEAVPLRHTYLRVLYPLLAHTQLKYPPHYKRDELRRMLNLLVPGLFSASDDEHERIIHFDDADSTTKRLVSRCASVEWLQDKDRSDSPKAGSPGVDRTISQQSDTVASVPILSLSPGAEDNEDTDGPFGTTRILSRPTTCSSPDTYSLTRPDIQVPSARSHQSYKPSLVQSLGVQLQPATSSSTSVQEVAALQHEQRSRNTPSPSFSDSTPSPTRTEKKFKVKPEPPKARRWRGRRGPGAEGHSPEPKSTATTPPPLPPASIDTTIETVTELTHSVSASLVPPVPSHPRSASHSPPAVPPPRRSTIAAHVRSHLILGSSNDNHSSNGHRNSNATYSSCDSVEAVGTTVPNLLHQPHHNKHGPKPEPPKSRRGSRTVAKHSYDTSLDSVENK